MKLWLICVHDKQLAELDAAVEVLAGSNFAYNKNRVLPAPVANFAVAKKQCTG